MLPFKLWGKKLLNTISKHDQKALFRLYERETLMLLKGLHWSGYNLLSQFAFEISLAKVGRLNLVLDDLKTNKVTSR